jgi:hypothetical protein
LSPITRETLRRFDCFERNVLPMCCSSGRMNVTQGQHRPTCNGNGDF